MCQPLLAVFEAWNALAHINAKITVQLTCFLQGTFADHWIIPLIQGYVEIREVPLLIGQTSDVAQGRYHHEAARLKKKESDVDLKMKAAAGGGGGGGRGEGRAMIEMTEMTSKVDVEQEEDDDEDLKGT